MDILDNTLFEAADRMIAGGQADMDEAGAHIKELLRRGANSNASRDGISLMAHLWRGRQRSEKEIAQHKKVAEDDLRGPREIARLDLIKTLLERGADPWLGQPSLWDIDTEQAWIEPSLLLGLFCEHEKEGVRMRGPNGDNPLHAILRHPSLGLCSFVLESDTHFLHPDWIHEANELGNTPLMTLWAEREEDCMHPEKIARAWGVTIDLQRAGADLFLANKQGVIGAELIQQYPGAMEVLERLPDNMEHTNDYRLACMVADDREGFLQQLETTLAHRHIDASTPVVSARAARKRI